MGTPLATARWADPARVEDQYLYRDGTVWLGRSANDTQSALGFDDDRHICLVSGSRGGKGTSSIINNLCLWPGSVVVIDPKGENATVTAARRGRGTPECEGLGQSVHVLDPFREASVEDAYRSRFNPMDALDPADEQCIDEAALIADSIVVVREDSKEPFWDEMARMIVRGLVLHILTAPEYEGRRNLVTLRELITRGDWEGVELLRELGEEDVPSAQGLLWEAVARNRAFNGKVAGIGETLAALVHKDAKVFYGVLQVANLNTEFIDSHGMEQCLTASDFKLSDLKTSQGGMSLYLSLPQRYMSTHYRWLRMMIGLTVSKMESVKGQPASGHRVLMLLDEFAGLQRMKRIEDAVAQMAGHGVKMFFVLQSLEQLKAVYKDNWETFLANCGLKLFFNLEDHFSREYVSKLIGETEVIRDVHSEGDNSSDSESSSESTSRSRSESTGESTSHGRSVTEGTSSSTSKSETHGRSRTAGHSWGWSYSQSGDPRELFGISRSSSRTSSISSSEGTSESWSRSETEGVSRGSSESSTEGKSRTIGSGSSETSGSTRGTTRGRTSGVSETIHRRPLISPDEIGKLFARIDDRDRAAYPGLGLALIAGQEPIAFRRMNYYEDLRFIGLFTPHPDHASLPVKRDTINFDILAEYQQYFPDGYPLQNFITVDSGKVVRAGDVIGCVRGPTEEGYGYVADINSPRTGRIVRTYGMTNLRLQENCTVLHYVSLEPRINPLGDLDAYCRGVAEKRRQKLLAEARRKQEEAERKARVESAARAAAKAAAFREEGEREIRQSRKRWLLASGMAGLVLLAGIVIPGATGSVTRVAIILVAFGVLCACGWKVRRTVAEERGIEKPEFLLAIESLPGLIAPKLPTLSANVYDELLKSGGKMTKEEFENFMKSFGKEK